MSQLLLAGAGRPGVSAPAGPTIPDVASSTRLLDLQADALVLSDGAAVATWSDASGLAHHFTQSGSARPTYRAGGGTPYVEFDGVDDWMLGSDFADNPASMTIFFVTTQLEGAYSNGPMLMKIGNDQCEDPGCTGWTTYSQRSFNVNQDTSNLIYQNNTGYATLGRHITTFEMVSVNELHAYADGVQTDQYPGGGDVSGDGVTNFGNSEPVRIGADGTGVGECDPASSVKYHAVMLYAPAPDASDSTAIRGWLADWWG